MIQLYGENRFSYEKFFKRFFAPDSLKFSKIFEKLVLENQIRSENCRI